MSLRMAIEPADPTDLDCTDFVAVLEPAVWITVDRFSVYLKRTDDGVLVDIYPLDDETSQPVASTYALDSDLPQPGGDK